MSTPKTVKTLIDAGIDKLATLVNDFANIEGRIMDQVIYEMRTRVAYLKWNTASFKNETKQKKDRSNDAREFNKGRMEALVVELKAKEYIKALFQLTWKENSKGEIVANAGAVQISEHKPKEAPLYYGARYSNTHNTLNSAWLIWAWNSPAAAFKALKADNAVTLITDWKAKYDESNADSDTGADNGAGAGANGEADQAPPLSSDAMPILSDSYNAAESFKRAAIALCEHHGEDATKMDLLAEYVETLQTIAKEIIELASEASETEHVSDADMANAAIAAAS